MLLPLFSMINDISRSRRAILFIAAVAVVVLVLGAAWVVRGRMQSGTPTTVGEGVAQVEMQRAGQRADICSAANAAGVGLRGEYFQKAQFAGADHATRTDPTVDFTGIPSWPVERVAVQPRSARWQGWVRPPISGRYKFHVEPAGALVFVARELMAGPGAAAGASVQLTAGRYYPISMEVPVIDSNTSSVRLEWTAPHGARFVVPRALLYLPTETVAPSTR